MITTKRLFLIPWHASDADELYELAKDPEIGPLCGWEPHKTLEKSLLQWLVSAASRRWASLQTLISTRAKKSSLVYQRSQERTGNVFKNSGSSRHVVCCFKMLYKANSYNQRQNYMQ